MRRYPSALLLDFDGVLRHFDPVARTEVERRHGLVPGSVTAALFEPDLLQAVVLGEITEAAWFARVGTALGAPDAMREWAGYRGEVDRDVLGFVREVRAAGVPVVLATNATDRLGDDLAHLGLAGDFDAVANSSVLRMAKPAPGFFLAACQAAGVPAGSCLFVDDHERNVRGARAAGLFAHRWSGRGDLAYLRACLALGKRPQPHT